MKNPNPPPPKPPAAMAPRKSLWGPPPAAGEKGASTSVRTTTPTPSSDSSRHPGRPAPGPIARNAASPAAAFRPPQPQLPVDTPQPPPYGFHNLDRRTIRFADGTVRTYFALPPDYPFEPIPLPPLPHLSRAGPDVWPPPQLAPHETKRKHLSDSDEGLHRYPKQPRFEPLHQPPQLPPHAAVDRHELRKAFLKYAKMLNESVAQRRSYLEGGRVPCLACGRSSKDFADVHGLVMHAYNPPNTDSSVDHLGLHKALCVLMGWDYTKVPENSKAYQSLLPDLVQASREDLIIWPPTVIIHNTATGRKKDGRCEGLGNKEMDKKVSELGFAGGKSKSLYGKEGHLGLTLIKFANSPTGLKEAERFAEFLERQDHGHNRTGEKRRVLYGYLAISSDLDELDSDSRKRASLKSRRELDPSD
ncbi:hypothetical protein GUJ93_ZPchr0013g35318 [Zizania palustris]|uniref:XS domain-containing protein n=1 Tax=Zizania palustris TaxID=103762 RepID=A0A8J6BXT9_ZIZPA|nr:hypothetical protein GUJ93_ZPchr0013g35318 [Zizania palustris]